MHIFGKYVNSIRDFNHLRHELAEAILSDRYYQYFLTGKPARDGIKGYNPSKCIHPKSDIPLTDHLARELIANALKKYSCIENNSKWSKNWQRKTKKGEHDVFTYVYKHYSGEVTKDTFIKIQVQTDCPKKYFKYSTRINKCIGFHPSGY